MKTAKEPNYSQRLKEAIGKRSPERWVGYIRWKLCGEPENLQKWTAQVIVNNYPSGAAYHTDLDDFSDPYGPWQHGYEYRDDDQERAFLKLGLPYEKSEPHRKRDDTRIYRRRGSANKRKDAYESISKTAEVRHKPQPLRGDR